MESAVLSALAQPTRLKIVELMRGGPLSVNEIAERLELGQPQTSKHLHVLSKARLVQVRQEANRRIYSLHRKRFEELEEWIATFTRQLKEQYERLDVFLTTTENDD